MGSVCSGGSTEIVCSGSFDMPGVPAYVFEEIYSDVKATPSFVPLILSIEMVRGEPSQVGACWLERRQVKNFEVVLKRTITKRADNPFLLGAVTELVETNSWSTPDFEGTYTIVIEPCSSADGSPSCTIHWTDAVVSRGIMGRFLSVFCVPCLKRQWITETEAQWQQYYEESLRRTINIREARATQAADDAIPEKRESEQALKRSQL